MNNVFAAKLLQNLRNKKANKGFTLIELLVVVIIIGVLAAVALPNLLGQVAKGRQAEARNTLGTVNRAQQANRLEFGTFGNLGQYTESTTVAGEIDVFVAPTVNPLPLALQLEYYAIGDEVADSASATVATINATASTIYENDVLDYQAQVTQTATGQFASIICQEQGINTSPGAPLAADDTDTDGLVDGCANGTEVK